MNELSGLVALAVGLIFFGVYSYRLGIAPTFTHDDYEYTYPSFSLAERGTFGSPLLGPGLNAQNRTYNLTVYYYATVHAVLIRIFGDGPSSIPLANTLHFGLLAAGGAFFLMRRRALLGLGVFIYALTRDERMIEAARHGRPEMTAGFCLLMGVLGLWVWRGEGCRRPLVLFGVGAAFTAGILAHTSVLFFAAALLLVYAVPLAREASPRARVAALLPYAAIPLLYGYFILTDDLANIRGQLTQAQGNVTLLRVLALPLHGEWRELGSLTADFVQTHVGHPGIWLALTACLALPVVAPVPFSRAARFFAGTYCLFVAVHFLFLKHFVLSYRAIYQATFYLALAFLAEAITARLGELLRQPAWVTALRVAGLGVLLCLSVAGGSRFLAGLRGQRLPYAQLQGALLDALLESGARPGDRVYVPVPFAFHLQRKFDVIGYPAPGQYFQGRWTPAFRAGVREVWGADALTRVDGRTLCWAMGLTFLQPKWVLSWNGDYSVMQPFREFLRRFPDLPGIQLTEVRRTPLPPPFGGTVRVYRLGLSEAMDALDRSSTTEQPPCP
ncbi:MAG TPA: hypothetical protein VN375_15500 [Vicinamibacteria bacterium]|nr:hypothetical protein [Vicinamibacteria bacterium]